MFKFKATVTKLKFTSFPNAAFCFNDLFLIDLLLLYVTLFIFFIFLLVYKLCANIL